MDKKLVYIVKHNMYLLLEEVITCIGVKEMNMNGCSYINKKINGDESNVRMYVDLDQFKKKYYKDGHHNSYNRRIVDVIENYIKQNKIKDYINKL